MTWLRNRLKERTTWIGLLAFAGLFGIRVRPELQEAIITAAVALGAVIEIVCKEKPDDLPAADSQAPRAELPPIELQSRPDSVSARRLADSGTDLVSGRRVVAVAGDGAAGADERMQSPVSSKRQSESFGFNDR